jgi:peptidoglycan/LPS O-acetylase OafA/YrhL
LKLSETAHGRDNNFNLIRFVAAFAVLLSHSFVLATGEASAEPLRTRYGFTFGDLAVDIFFITSGFLVTASLLTRKGVVAFIWARTLRILPALWAMLCLTVFIMGLSLTTQSPAAYLHAHQTWSYFLTNATLFNGIEYELPGLFAHNPARYSVNGSLWTLAPEVYEYTGLLALWLAAALTRRYRPRALHYAILAVFIFSALKYLSAGRFETSQPLPRLTCMFFAGASYYILRDLIDLRKRLCALLLAAISVCLFTRTAYFLALNLSLPYLVMCAAYAFSGPIRSFNRLGDYSYGIYIYSYPVEQTIASLDHGISVAALAALSSATTLALAMISWHLLEKRALALKRVCANRTQSWIDSWYPQKLSSAEARTLEE